MNDPISDPNEFIKGLRFDVSSDEVYVFTPKGDVIALPIGSTPVDFAYAIHTELGHACSVARVNGKPAPLETVLAGGDLVEIFTYDAVAPNRDWLRFVKSPRARAKIQQFFGKEQE
jgi:GTP pyrophosphokinase